MWNNIRAVRETLAINARTNSRVYRDGELDLSTYSGDPEHCCVLLRTGAAFSALTVRHAPLTLLREHFPSGSTVSQPRKAPVLMMPENSTHFILSVGHHLSSGLHFLPFTAKHVGHLRPLELNSFTFFSSRSLIVISQETGGWGAVGQDKTENWQAVGHRQEKYRCPKSWSPWPVLPS